MKTIADRFVLCAILAVVTLMGCGKDEKEPLAIPASYDGAAFAANTGTQTAVRSQLEQLVAEIKKGRTSGVVLDFTTLHDLFVIGNPSLYAITTPYYRSQIDGAGSWLDELAKASGGAYTPGAPAGGQGGVYGSYLFDENGLELEQMVEKGLFGAALYNHALALTQDGITLAEVDQMASVFGAPPSFPNTNNAASTPTPDKFLAGYAARRDKNDGNGLYTAIRDNFIKLQAAVKAGDNYKQEQEEALAAILENWEKANAATIINYCHSVISALSATNPTDGQKSGALHSCSEAVGFINGWRTIAQKTITDAEIDEILTLFNAPLLETPALYKFATDPVNELPKLTQAIDKLKAIYGFSTQDIEDFRKNWVAEQGR
jgi:hypothetical protein